MNEPVIIGDATLICADVMEGLNSLPDQSVQMCVTSPPYYNLRNYNDERQIGQEPFLSEYIENLVYIFGKLKRILKDDGTFWLNIGDSMVSGKGSCFNPGGGNDSLGKNRKEAGAHPLNRGNISDLKKDNLKPKDLMMVPARLAIALCDDGWYLRSDIIWQKSNPLCESVKDRPTSSHEHIFLLAKSKKYFYDYKAVLEPFADSNIERISQKNFDNQTGGPKDPKIGNRSHRKALENLKGNARYKHAFRSQHRGSPVDDRHQDGKVIEDEIFNPAGRNLRNVWKFATDQNRWAMCKSCKEWYKKPPDLCPECNGNDFDGHYASFPKELPLKCILAGSKEGDIILDPFMGSGTTGIVAPNHGRKFIGIELNLDYVRLSIKRIQKEASQIKLF